MAVVGTFAKFDDRNYRYARAIAPVIGNGIREVVRTFAERIQQNVIQSMEGPKSGRVYEKPGGGTHIASAPGESPAVWSGRLRDAIKIRYRFGGMVADIGVLDGDPNYGHIHETGDGRPMRPFMKPAFDSNSKEFAVALRGVLNRLV